MLTSTPEHGLLQEPDLLPSISGPLQYRVKQNLGSPQCVLGFIMNAYVVRGLHTWNQCGVCSFPNPESLEARV